MQDKKRFFLLGIGLVILIVTILILLPGEQADELLVINEVMSSNGYTVSDEEGDYADWIELYNGGEEPINLRGYFLSDDNTTVTKWQFPGVTIEPKAHLVVWASGKDMATEAGQVHTNFSISSQGEPIFLTRPDGRTIVDAIEVMAIPRDVSYGRETDGDSQWVFFDIPTPGRSNNQVAGHEELLRGPTFSHVGGFYTDEITLALTTDESSKIYYTLDGSEPDENALVYQGTITITPQMLEDHFPMQDIQQGDAPKAPLSFINTTAEDLSEEWGYDRYRWVAPQGEQMMGAVVRARAYGEEGQASRIITHSYFVDENIYERFDLPVISISTDSKGLFSYEEGIYIPGKVFYEWRNQNPTERVIGNTPANYNARTIEAERTAHIEFFEPNGVLGFSQGAGLRIHGGFTRAWAQKSLRLYARRDYDQDNSFRYEVFPGATKAVNHEPLNEFRRLILRNSGNDWSVTMFRDAFIQELVKDFNIDTQAHRPAIVFINGEYWGIHNIRERYDANYLETNYDVNPEDVVLINTSGPVVEEGFPEDYEHFENMLRFLEENDIKEQSNYEYIKTLMDVENFIDYQIAGIYIANTDWLANNVRLWRLRTEEYQPGAPYGHDGRWRWMLYDVDFGFAFDNQEMVQHNTLQWATTDQGEDRNAPQYTFLLRTLLQNEEFRNEFINRFEDHLKTTFQEEYVINLINEMQSGIEKEMGYNIQRWPNFGSISVWNDNVEVMREFGRKRPAYMYEHLMRQFDLQEEVHVN
ncbi:Spore coat protein CotH [Alkaliphilus metalliredigens QYMF]|uniref:Spore coat protein CotH n=1 Tax=Alkaliphilus metalliredigens (strain QYMF) TaxID=293826 RepID=A6TJQ9_ALKMQ|nr:CotH kinase family protein [Alkaliphilus metalliredigens]ABR46427.1 Spore coat protein CotH [Alkaliphilus metalliredigens QYMF]